MRSFTAGFLAGMVTVCVFSLLFVWLELRRSPTRSSYTVTVECETAEAASRAAQALCAMSSKVVTVQRPKHPSFGPESCPDFYEEWN